MFKNLVLGAALSLSTFAMASPPRPGGFGNRPVMDQRSDAFDVNQGRRLLRELDQVTMRDYRSVRTLDARISAFIEAEFTESRREHRNERQGRERREERMSTRQLTRLLGAMRQVEGRFNPRAMAEKRRVLVEAVNIAERDAVDARQDRISRR